MSLNNDTQPLPSPAVIDASMATIEADVAEMFGLGEQPAGEAVSGGETSGGASPSSTPASSEPAGGGEQAPSPPADTSPAAEPAATPASPTPEGTPAPATPPAAPGAEGAPTAPPAAPVDEQALRVHSLEATVQALTQQLEQLRANPSSGQPPAQGTESGSQPAVEPPPGYRLTLPQPVFEAIFGENATPETQQAGVVNLINNLASIVHHNVRQEYRAALNGLVQAAREQEQIGQRTDAAAKGREDYYRAFPQHQNELVRPLIADEAQKMAGEFPNLAWGTDYINALGVRVNNRIAALTAAAQPAVQTPAPAPAASLPTGTRTETPGTALTGEDLIMDTFSS